MISFPHSPERNDKGEVVSAVDWLGNRFYLGDRVLYCLGNGNCRVMAIGEVTKIYAVLRQAKEFRAPEPGEEPDWINTHADPPIGYVQYTKFYDDVSVQVRTLRTASPYDQGERSKSGWVTAENVTSLRLREGQKK